MPGTNGVSPAVSPLAGPPEPARAAPREERGGGYAMPPAREERPARPPAAPQPPAPLRQPPPEEEEEDANSYDSDEGSAYPGGVGAGWDPRFRGETLGFGEVAAAGLCCAHRPGVAPPLPTGL